MSIPPLLETQLGKYYDLKEKKEKKTAFSQKKKKKKKSPELFSKRFQYDG